MVAIAKSFNPMFVWRKTIDVFSCKRDNSNILGQRDVATYLQESSMLFFLEVSSPVAERRSASGEGLGGNLAVYDRS